MTNEYVAIETCINCLKQTYLNIPLGVTINEFVKDKKCKNCGCSLNGDYNE